MWTYRTRSALPKILASLLLACIGCRGARDQPLPARCDSSEASLPAELPPLPASARTEDERNTIDVFHRAAPSAVFVTQNQMVVDSWQGKAMEVPAGAGTGFVWDDDGHIVTNFHVVADARSVTVTLQDQHTYRARVVGTEPRRDIALLHIDAPRGALHPVTLPETNGRLEVGQKVVAIGNPFGLDHTLTTGIISALGREVAGVGGVTIRDMIQTDAAINPGNSGGPLLDSAGRLIGMNTMIFSKSGSSSGIGFAVPIQTIRRIVPQLVRNGHVEQVGFGARVDPQQRIERRLRIPGVVVLEVEAGTAAEKAGIQGLSQTPDGLVLGDVIVAFAGQPVKDYDDLYNALDGRKPGEQAKLVIRRGSQSIEATVELALVE